MLNIGRVPTPIDSSCLVTSIRAVESGQIVKTCLSDSLSPRILKLALKEIEKAQITLNQFSFGQVPRAHH